MSDVWSWYLVVEDSINESYCGRVSCEVVFAVNHSASSWRIKDKQPITTSLLCYTRLHY
jgi:hypothetical protein